MLQTPKERVALLKAGVDLSTIEQIYLEINNIKLLQKSVLFDNYAGKFPVDLCRASQFEGVEVKKSYGKTKYIMISGLILLVIGYIYPVSVLFNTFLCFLFLPPIILAGSLMIDFIQIILMGLDHLSVPRAAKVIYSYPRN